METWYSIGGPPDGAEEPFKGATRRESINWQQNSGTGSPCSPAMSNHCSGDPGMRELCDNNNSADGGANEARQSSPTRESRLLLFECNKAPSATAVGQVEPEVRQRKHAPAIVSEPKFLGGCPALEEHSKCERKTASVLLQSTKQSCLDIGQRVTRQLHTPVSSATTSHTTDPTSSVTSDYFSSPSHSSPIVIRSQTASSSASLLQTSHNTNRRRHKNQRGTIIYENPSFLAHSYGGQRMPETAISQSSDREANKLKEEEESRMTRRRSIEGSDKPARLTSLSGTRACLGTSVNSNYAPGRGQSSPPHDISQKPADQATTDSPAPHLISAHTPRHWSDSNGSASSSGSSVSSSSFSKSADRRQARHAKLASAAIAFASLELATENNSTTAASHYKSPLPSQVSAYKKPQTLARNSSQQQQQQQQQQVSSDSRLLRALASSQRLSMGPQTTVTSMHQPPAPTSQHQNLYGTCMAPQQNPDPQAAQMYGYAATSELSSSLAAVRDPQADYSSDYHYYQVVVPPTQSTSNHRLAPISPPTTTMHHSNHETRTLQANLVNSEPLIGSCSWRNKTLINLNSQAPSANYYCAPQMQDHGAPDQPRYAPFSPIPTIELARIQHHQPHQQQQHHYLAATYSSQNSALLARHLAEKRAAQMSNVERSFATKRLPFGFLSARLFLLLLLLAASLALFLLALLSNKLSVNKVQGDETGAAAAAGPISSNDEPYMHRQLMGLPTFGLKGPQTLGQPHFNLTPPGGLSSFVSGAASDTTSSHQFSEQPSRMNTPTPRATDAAAATNSDPLAPLDKGGPSAAPPAASSGPSYAQLPAPDYWHQSDNQPGSTQCNPSSQDACNLQGLCINRVCRCFAGYSGPTCARVDCAEDCSQRGSCQLRPDKPINQLLAGARSPDTTGSPHQHMLGPTSSIAFSSLTSARHLSSMCPHTRVDNSSTLGGSSSSFVVDAADIGQPRTYDHRLEWQCSCRTGFAGPKCERLEELDCANYRDDDHDGLVDCDDDDCCSQPACSQIFVCYTSPEPQLVLEQLAATSGASWRPSTIDNKQQQQQPLFGLVNGLPKANGEAFYAQMRFLIANKSMQSYVHESAFEASRVAVIRGRVVKWATPEGIVSVRVAVVENERLGFTLTRHDGSFDLLVNGNEWLTLELHKNAYTPLKHRIFVSPLTINQLDQELVMWLAASTSASGSSSTNQHQQQQQVTSGRADFGSSVLAELHQLAWSATTKDDPRRTNLLQCLLNVARSPDNTNLHSEMAQARPRFVRGVAEGTDFVLVSSGASFGASIELPGLQQSPPAPIGFAYNSAMFPPAASLVKSQLVVQLLEQQKPLPASLTGILVQFDVEGQMKSERLQPIVGLSYQFAWNRRNVYQQKVYGFAQLIVRIGYEFTTTNATTTYPLWQSCLAGHQMDSSGAADWSKSESFLANLGRRWLWFERRLHLEAHQLNHHADLAKWQLPSLNRLDPDRELIYFGAGWSVPFRWAYPPVVCEPVRLFPQHHDTAHRATGTRATMTHGPPDSMFMILQGRLIQLDVSGGSHRGPPSSSAHRKLIDVPLATLSTKLGGPPTTTGPNQARSPNPEPLDDDLQLIYNNHQSMLYVSSRSAAKIVQVSLSSLLVLNRTQAGQSPTSAPEDEIDIEPLCGFGRHPLSMEGEPVRLARSVRLSGPHALTLDEQRQILYFIDGASSLMALELQTRRLSLVPALVSAQQAANFRQQFKPLSSARGPCEHLPPIHWTQFTPVKLRGLKWARSQSALLFIDQNTVFSLGQDMFVRILATGSSSPYRLADSDEACIKLPELGEIKMLLVDDSTDNLFVIHQWHPLTYNSDSTKLDGHLYLARLKLGITQSLSQPQTLVDLHSARSAWDPTIKELAMAAASNKTTINWLDISLNPVAQLMAKQQSAKSQHQVNSSGQSTTTKIPFIHLQNGFERIDSIGINSGGSIFVLDSNANSIRKIAAYSPNEFNLIERHDVNINRLFVTNPQPTQYYLSLYASAPKQPVYYANQTKGLQLDESETNKLNVLIIQNPISGETLEFHATTGLQLASFKPASSSGTGYFQDSFSSEPPSRRIEFYYKVISPITRMIEDDANDFQATKLAKNYKLLDFYDSSQQQNRRSSIKLSSNHLGPAYIRLDKISDISNGDVYELQRFDTGSEVVLQSVLLNDQSICELTTDFMGVLTSIHLLHQDSRTELVYDGSLYLLTEMATKSSQQLQATRQSSDSTELQVHTPIKTWRQLKKIAYDNLFYHYCNLIIANL